MKRILLSLIISIPLLILLFGIKIIFALPDIAHKELTEMSSDVKHSLQGSKENGLWNAMESFPGGYEKGFKDKVPSANLSQDYPPNSTFGAQHYFDPSTGMGLYGIFPSAKSRALDLYNSAIQVQCFSIPLGLVNSNSTRPWELFAQAEHLMQDMVTPAHTTAAKDHADGDSFEKYVEKNWGNWDAGTPEEGKIINPQTGQPYNGLRDYVADIANRQTYDSTYQLSSVSEYFNRLAKESQSLPRDGIKIVTDPTTGMAYPERVPLTWEQKKRIAQEQLPKALMYGAGLINKFWDDINKSDMRTICIKYSAIPAGGDHSDDNLDVSNEFYWQNQFQLSEADLTHLYLKTAIKKGKIGVWYKKQFIDTYVDLATIYKDSPNEIKNPILAKLYNVGKKLEQRVNQLESDWKGAPDVALLTNGFYASSISLMLKFGEPVLLQDSNFNPTTMTDHPVLVIPSGGLFGLENSEYLLKPNFQIEIFQAARKV